MTTVKQTAIIGNSTYNTSDVEIITGRANDISITNDMDTLGGTLSFTLPYIDKANEAINSGSELIEIKNTLKKWTPIRIYYNEFEADPGDSDNLSLGTDLLQLFEGVVKNVKVSKSKGSYIYNIECYCTLAYIADEFKLKYSAQVEDYRGTEFFDFVINEAGVTNFINLDNVERQISGDADDVAVKWSTSDSLREIFEKPRDDFGIRIHQNMDGSVKIFDPLYFFTQDKVVAYEFVLDYNMFNIDYGDLTTDIQVVRVIGNGFVAYAIDPTGIALKSSTTGISEDELALYRTRTLYRMNLTSKDEGELLAKNYLLEEMRNNVVTFQTKIIPELKIGDFITVDDGEIYTGTVMIVKSFTINLNKSDCSMSITAYRSVLATQPESLVVDKIGITDLDILDIRKSVEDTGGWNDFN